MNGNQHALSLETIANRWWISQWIMKATTSYNESPNGTWFSGLKPLLPGTSSSIAYKNEVDDKLLPNDVNDEELETLKLSLLLIFEIEIQRKTDVSYLIEKFELNYSIASLKSIPSLNHAHLAVQQCVYHNFPFDVLCFDFILFLIKF